MNQETASHSPATGGLWEGWSQNPHRSSRARACLGFIPDLASHSPNPPVGSGRPTSHPFGVFHRRDRRDPWRLILTAPTEAEARSRMFDVMADGDWCVSSTSTPPGRKGAR